MMQKKLIELKKVLRECLHFNYDEFSCNMSLDEDLTAEKLIAHGVTVQEWIPVTERLPDVDGFYIVTACDEGCSYGEGIWYDTVVVVAEYYRGSWSWNENGTEYDLCGIVTHWMPLPEPPKEG